MPYTMHITVNGETKAVPAGVTLRALVEELGLGQAAVAAEVNKAVVPRRDHDSTRLAEGDAVELVTLVGGG